MNEEMMNQSYSQAGAYSESLGRYTAKTFGWMFAGLLVTFAVAVGGVFTGAIFLLNYVPAWPYVLLFAELGVVLFLSARISKMSVVTARVLFFVYAILNGIVFSAYFYVYDLMILWSDVYKRQHPEWWLVGMSVEDQVRLVKDYDVILERCYAQNLGGGKYKSNLPDNLEIIKTVGYKNVMVDTDGGQVENPHWELAMEEYMQYLLDHGIPEEQVRYMTHDIPAGLLGIEN